MGNDGKAKLGYFLTIRYIVTFDHEHEGRSLARLIRLGYVIRYPPAPRDVSRSVPDDPPTHSPSQSPCEPIQIPAPTAPSSNLTSGDRQRLELASRSYVNLAHLITHPGPGTIQSALCNLPQHFSRTAVGGGGAAVSHRAHPANVRNLGFLEIGFHWRGGKG